MSELTSYKALGNDIYAGPTPNLNIVKYLKNLNIKKILCLDDVTNKKAKDIINQEGLGNIYTEIGISSTAFNQSKINYLKNNIKNIFSKRPIYVFSSESIDKISFAIAIYKIIGMSQSPKEVINELKNKLNFGKVGTSIQVYSSWEKYLLLLDPKNKDLSMTTETGATIESSAADDGEFFENKLNKLVKNICNINNLPHPAEANKIPSFAPFADTPYQAIDPKLNDFFSAHYDRMDKMNKMIQMGQYSNMAQTRGAGAVEGEGPLNIYLI